MLENIPVETIAILISVLFMTISQIISICKGDLTRAEKLEIKKQKQISKLTTKRDKCLKEAVKNENKIKEINGNNEKSNTSL